MLDRHVEAVLTAYPTIHTAFKRRQVRDPSSGRRLSNHQAGILEHLDPVKPITVGALARLLRVTPATISIQLSRLLRLRLVARERDEEDARRVLIRLTEQGSRLRAERSLLDPDRVRAALERLEGVEQESAVGGLRILARAAGELPEAGREVRQPTKRGRRSAE